MTWLATLHGDLDHLTGEDRAAAEAKVADALGAVAGSLAADGHQGIGATFHGSAGDVNLLDPGAPIDAGPQGLPPGRTATDGDRPGEIDPADAPDPTQAGGPTAVGLPPGVAIAPTGPAPAADAPDGPAGAPAPDAGQ